MWGAIKKTINSNLNKPLDLLIQENITETHNKVDNANEKLGLTPDTGGSFNSGSIFAKINKLLTDWTTTRAGYLDSSISSRASQVTVDSLSQKVNNLELQINKNSIEMLDLSKLNKTILSDNGSSVIEVNLPLNTPIYALRFSARNYSPISINWGQTFINGVGANFFACNYLDSTTFISTESLELLAFMLGGKLIIEDKTINSSNVLWVRSFIILLGGKTFTSNTKVLVAFDRGGANATASYVLTKK